jgi:spermidine synthase
VTSRVSPFFPILLLLFVGSGCAALIYEVVWLQLLQLVIGSSAASLAVLLGTFMGGMCLGSLLLPRLISPDMHPLRVLALLESGTAACALAVLFGMPAIQSAYIESVGHWIPSLVLRSLACAICLLPPTMLMGATLPALSRWIEDSPGRASSWGFLYAGNIAGGVIGSLAAGFWLLRIYDMAIASYVAVCMNLAVAGVSLVLARTAAYDGGEERAAAAPAYLPGASRVLAALALSGLCALGAEVVWTRNLSLMLGATVYTFSIILGVFLTGLGIGSVAGSAIAKREVAQPRLWLAGCQILQAVTIFWAATLVAKILPYSAANFRSPASPWVGFIGDVVRCYTAILPSSMLWGASFPLALAGLAPAKGDSGRLVGEVYAANTVGAIVGSLGFSLIFIPEIGTQHSQQLLIALSVVAAVIVWPKGSLKLAAGVAAAALLAWAVPQTSWNLIGFGRKPRPGAWTLLYATEGMNSSIAYSRYNNVTTYFHVSGKVEASAAPQDMRLQRLLGHLPGLLHPNPRSVLVVGFGAGVTAGTFVVQPGIERITIVEIEPRIPPASAIYFSRENHGVVRDPRTRIIYDDARHFLLTSREKFDIISTDPIHPWVKGIAPLYSIEYFSMVKDHLKSGGFFTQWVPLYESTVEAVQSEFATFFEVFPHGTVWGNLNTDGSGFDVVLLGQEDSLRIDLAALDARLRTPAYAAVMQSLRDVGYNSTEALLATYAVKADDLRGWLRNAQINRDRNLRLQYLAGLGLYENLAPAIYDEMLNRATFPSDIFIGSADRLEATRRAIASMRRPLATR